MKALVVYYSRTGTTKNVAEATSRNINSDIEEIIDTKDRRGVRGYLIACKDAVTKQLTEIKGLQKDPSLYDIVIIGTPIWAFTITPAIRTYLTKNKERFKKVAFFCTQGSFGSKSAFKEMEAVCAKRPQALFEVTTNEVVRGTYMLYLEKFIEALRSGI